MKTMNEITKTKEEIVLNETQNNCLEKYQAPTVEVICQTCFFGIKPIKPFTNIHWYNVRVYNTGSDVTNVSEAVV